MAKSLTLRSLKAKILGASLISLIGCIGVIWYGSQRTLLQTAQSQVDVNLEAAVTGAKSRLTDFHRNRWREINMTVKNVAQQWTPEENVRVQRELNAAKASLQYFSELYIADPQGKVLYSTTPGRKGVRDERRVALRAIEDGAVRYLDGPYWDDETNRLGATTSSFHDGATLTYASPLVVNSERVGAVMARLPSDIQADFIQKSDANIFGKSGDTMVFMVKSSAGVQPGTALSRSRFENASDEQSINLKQGIALPNGEIVQIERSTELELVLKHPTNNGLTAVVQGIIDEEEAALTSPSGFIDHRNIEVVGSGSTVTVPGSPDEWGIVATADVSEAYANIAESTETFALLAIASTAVASAFLALIVFGPLTSLAKLTTSIRSTSQSVNDTSSSIGRSASSLANSATDQSSAIAETMASMEEITAMVASNSESANEALSIAQSASGDASNGAGVVAEMSDAMNSIADQNTQLAQVVEIIENISDKTKIINDIVFETKLLSFNASIEAARAGEQGKGFAVVADEVGNLARLSGKAAQEIHALIEQSTKQVHLMVSVTKDSIAEGVAVTERANNAFESIRDGVTKVASMMDAIALASSEQQQGIAQVSKAMAQMDSLTQNTAAAASDAASQSDALKHAGGDLRQVVDSLHLLIDGSNDDDVAPASKQTKGSSDSDKSGSGDFGDGDDFSSNDGDYDAELAGIGEIPESNDSAFI